MFEPEVVEQVWDEGEQCWVKMTHDGTVKVASELNFEVTAGEEMKNDA